MSRVTEWEYHNEIEYFPSKNFVSVKNFLSAALGFQQFSAPSRKKDAATYQCWVRRKRHWTLNDYIVYTKTPRTWAFLNFNWTSQECYNWRIPSLLNINHSYVKLRWELRHISVMWQYSKLTFPSYSAPLSSCIEKDPIYDITVFTIFLLFLLPWDTSHAWRRRD